MNTFGGIVAQWVVYLNGSSWIISNDIVEIIKTLEVTSFKKKSKYALADQAGEKWLKTNKLDMDTTTPDKGTVGETQILFNLTIELKDIANLMVMVDLYRNTYGRTIIVHMTNTQYESRQDLEQALIDYNNRRFCKTKSARNH